MLDPWTTFFVVVVILFVLLLMGLPMAVVLGGCGALGMFLGRRAAGGSGAARIMSL